MTYTIEISILSKAPQNLSKSLSIGDIEIKKINQKIDLKNVIKAVKSCFKVASFPRLVSSSISESEFRETVNLEIHSFRELNNIDIEGIEKSMFTIRINKVYV